MAPVALQGHVSTMDSNLTEQAQAWSVWLHWNRVRFLAVDRQVDCSPFHL
ncbi:MAG: hypothetical protein ABIR36_08715 [Nitrospiraceae bacterium]